MGPDQFVSGLLLADFESSSIYSQDCEDIQIQGTVPAQSELFAP